VNYYSAQKGTPKDESSLVPRFRNFPGLHCKAEDPFLEKHDVDINGSLHSGIIGLQYWNYHIILWDYHFLVGLLALEREEKCSGEALIS
jgi:hypothetical protein